MEYAGPKVDGEAAQANATNGMVKVDEATDVKIGEDASAGEGGHGLCHGMAELKAAMAMPGSTAAHFAEQARASQATVEEVATKHEVVCRAIVDDQARTLGAALGPKAMERTYLAMPNAEGFSVMHGLVHWWAEAPGGACNQHGQMVAFEGEVWLGTNVPNLCRFEEPDEEIFQLLTLPPVLLSNMPTIM